LKQLTQMRPILEAVLSPVRRAPRREANVVIGLHTHPN
jgi:hypothetical protein